jgi:hypothetical protein
MCHCKLQQSCICHCNAYPLCAIELQNQFRLCHPHHFLSVFSKNDHTALIFNFELARAASLLHPASVCTLDPHHPCTVSCGPWRPCRVLDHRCKQSWQPGEPSCLPTCAALGRRAGAFLSFHTFDRSKMAYMG